MGIEEVSIQLKLLWSVGGNFRFEDFSWMLQRATERCDGPLVARGPL